jgi:hypothetical protein
MMQQQDLIQLLKPIEKYITDNKKSLSLKASHIPAIVQKFFPSNEKLGEIANYLRDSLPAFRALTPEKRLERTRQVLTNALNDSALIHFNSIRDEDTDGFSMEEIESEFDNFLDDEEYDNFYPEED